MIFKLILAFQMLISPTGDYIRLNCGGPTVSDSSGRSFREDLDLGIMGSLWTVSGTGVKDIYTTLRYGSSFTYLFKVNQEQLYWIRFHFIEPTVRLPKARIFDIIVNDVVVFKNIDLYSEGGFLQSFTKSTLVDTPSEAMKIEFKTSVRSAVCSGIEIMPIKDKTLDSLFHSNVASPDSLAESINNAIRYALYLKHKQDKQ